MILVQVAKSWLEWVVDGLEVAVDDMSELYDDMSVGVMNTVEAIRAKRLVGVDVSIAELADALMDVTYEKDGEVKALDAEDHRKALALTAAIAMRYLADERH